MGTKLAHSAWDYALIALRLACLISIIYGFHMQMSDPYFRTLVARAKMALIACRQLSGPPLRWGLSSIPDACRATLIRTRLPLVFDHFVGHMYNDRNVPGPCMCRHAGTVSWYCYMEPCSCASSKPWIGEHMHLVSVLLPIEAVVTLYACSMWFLFPSATIAPDAAEVGYCLAGGSPY